MEAALRGQLLDGGTAWVTRHVIEDTDDPGCIARGGRRGDRDLLARAPIEEGEIGTGGVGESLRKAVAAAARSAVIEEGAVVAEDRRQGWHHSSGARTVTSSRRSATTTREWDRRDASDDRGDEDLDDDGGGEPESDQSTDRRASRRRTRLPPRRSGRVARARGSRQWSLTSTYGSDPSGWVREGHRRPPGPPRRSRCLGEPPGPARNASRTCRRLGPSRIRTWAMGTGGVSALGSAAREGDRSMRPRVRLDSGIRTGAGPARSPATNQTEQDQADR